MARPKSAAPFESPDDIEHQFYEALQHGDLERLMAVWADDEDISCVHPRGPRVVGIHAIRAAFEVIFANGAVDARPENVRRLQTHSCAVHSVFERVHLETPEGAQTAWVIATNVYVLGANGWRMVAHHASPGSSTAVHEVVDKPSTILH